MMFMTMQERNRFFRENGRRQDIALYTVPLRLRVYARVSTEQESQINALENQLEWYKTRIASNWIFNPDTDFYVDRGITGTHAWERGAFLRMMADAKQNPDSFDIIITRDVSRFARNVEDVFRYTRELAEQGIGVLFILESIWSFDDSVDGLIRLSIMASQAQGESMKISERTKAGQEIVRKNGQPFGNGSVLGYDLVFHAKNRDIDPRTGQPYNTTFTYAINEEQAGTVRRIYELSNQGYGGKRICNILKSENRRMAKGGTNWNPTTVIRILKNPIYMGYNVYGRSRVEDCLSHKRVYEYDIDKLKLVKGDWEPIITEEEWHLAQGICSKRKKVVIDHDKKKNQGTIVSKSVWGRKMQCQCGAGFRRTPWRQNKLSGEEIYGYRCYSQISYGSRRDNEENGITLSNACGVRQVQECKMEIMAKRIFETIWKNQRESMKLAVEMITECYMDRNNDCSARVAQLEAKIKAEEDSKVNAGMLAAKGLIDEATLKTMMVRMDENIRGYRAAMDSLEGSMDTGTKETALKNVEKALSEVIDFSQPVIDSGIIDKFVYKILVNEAEFVWILDFSGRGSMMDDRHIKYEDRKELVRDYNVFLEFDIPFEEAREYMKSRGRRLVRQGWDTLKVKVALIDLNTNTRSHN
ncbi:MAG: recombinase family protein [Lachnospiraceae bacterium]|nr:recombinase family protein [Lachnospiraceae bacterium]